MNLFQNHGVGINSVQLVPVEHSVHKYQAEQESYTTDSVCLSSIYQMSAF